MTPKRFIGAVAFICAVLALLNVTPPVPTLGVAVLLLSVAEMI